MKNTKAALTEILALANKIYKANTTYATQVELCKFVGSVESPETLALRAAKMIYHNKGTVNFSY